MNELEIKLVEFSNNLVMINHRLGEIYKGKHPTITIYGSGGWSVEIDGDYHGHPCRIGNKVGGKSISELFEFLNNN